MLQFLKEIDELPKERECLEDNEWLNDLAFLVDITDHLNVLNTKLQGRDKLFSDMCNEITAFKMKLQLFAGHQAAKRSDMCNEIIAFKMKLQLFACHLAAKRFEHFEHLKERSLQLRQLADASVDADEYAEKIETLFVSFQAIFFLFQ